MAGQHYSRKNEPARKRERHLRTAIGSLRGGTRTAGPVRLGVSSRRFYGMSRCGGAWEMEPWTARADPSWSGLRLGGVGCSRSVARSLTRTSTRAVRSVVKSVLLSDSILDAAQRGDDPSDGAEESPERASTGELRHHARDRYTEDEEQHDPVREHHIDESNRLNGEAVRDG